MSSASDPPPINRRKLDLATDHSPAILRELAKTFLQHGASLKEEVRRAAEASDQAKLSEAAHRVKGALAMIGADPGYALAEQLESQLEQGAWTAKSRLPAELVAELQRVLEVLEQILAESGEESGSSGRGPTG